MLFLFNLFKIAPPRTLMDRKSSIFISPLIFDPSLSVDISQANTTDSGNYFTQVKYFLYQKHVLGIFVSFLLYLNFVTLNVLILFLHKLQVFDLLLMKRKYWQSTCWIKKLQLIWELISCFPGFECVCHVCVLKL